MFFCVIPASSKGRLTSGQKAGIQPKITFYNMIKTYYRHSRMKFTVRSVSRMLFKNFIRRKILIFSLIALLVILPISYMVFKNKSTVEAAWMNDNWGFRKAISIPSHTTLETNVYVAVPTFDATDTTKFQADCGDLRFTKQNGEQLPYYVVDCDATANIHVQFDSLPAGASTYYMYYGLMSDKSVAFVGTLAL